MPLTLSNPAIANYAEYAFADEADVLINARLAADAAGATKDGSPGMGRRESHQRGSVLYPDQQPYPAAAVAAPRPPLDAANPRFYADTKGDKTSQGNVNGHIIRWREAGNNPAANTFAWDVYLFGAQADADANVNLSGLTDENDFSSPDGNLVQRSHPRSAVGTNR